MTDANYGLFFPQGVWVYVIVTTVFQTSIWKHGYLSSLTASPRIRFWFHRKRTSKWRHKSVIASHITSNSTVHSIGYSGWQWRKYRIISPLWMETTGHYGVPLQKTSDGQNAQCHGVIMIAYISVRVSSRKHRHFWFWFPNNRSGECVTCKNVLYLDCHLLPFSW